MSIAHLEAFIDIGMESALKYIKNSGQAGVFSFSKNR